MKTVSQVQIYEAPPEAVFDALDDLGVTGMHMTKSSMPIMGGKMHLEFLSNTRRDLNTHYRWTSSILGMKMEFTVGVTS